MDRVTSQGRLLAFDQSSTSKFLHFTVRSEKLSTLEVEDHCKWQTLYLWFSDRPALTFKIFLFDKVVVRSEMRLGKLRHNNTVKADRRPFFGSEDVSHQRETPCPSSLRHGPLSPRQRTPLWPPPWRHAPFVHSCQGFCWAPLAFQTLVEAAPQKDYASCWRSQHFLMENRLRTNCTFTPQSELCLLSCVPGGSACGLWVLSTFHTTRTADMSPVQTTPPASRFLFPTALGGPRGLCNLACPRPDSWQLPAQSSFFLHLSHLK